MQISITFDPNKDSDVSAVKQLLNKLYGAKIEGVPIRDIVVHPTGQAELKDVSEPIQIQKEPVVKHVDTAEQAKEEVKLSIETLRINTQAALVAGHKASVQALLKKYEAGSVSQLKEEHWPAYNAEIIKLNESK